MGLQKPDLVSLKGTVKEKTEMPNKIFYRYGRMDKPRDDDDSRHLLHNSVAQISHLLPSMPTHGSHTFSIAQEKANRLSSVAVAWTSLGNSNSLRHPASGIKVLCQLHVFLGSFRMWRSREGCDKQSEYLGAQTVG